MEEFATVIEAGRLIGDVIHIYPERTIHLFFYSATVTEGNLTPLEHQDIKWADMKTLLEGGLLAEGDCTFVKEFLAKT